MSNCQCRKVYRATTATVSNNALVLSFSETPVFTNTGRFWFTVDPSIVNTGTAVYPVALNMNVGGTVTAVPLWNGWANIAYSNSVHRGFVYKAGMGSITSTHVIAYNLDT